MLTATPAASNKSSRVLAACSALRVALLHAHLHHQTASVTRRESDPPQVQRIRVRIRERVLSMFLRHCLQLRPTYYPDFSATLASSGRRAS